MRISAFGLCVTLALLAPALSHADTRPAVDKHDKHDVQWIKRCDRMKEQKRFDCLGEMRAAAAARYAKQDKESGEGAAAAAEPQREADAPPPRPKSSD